MVIVSENNRAAGKKAASNRINVEYTGRRKTESNSTETLTPYTTLAIFLAEKQPAAFENKQPS